MNIHKNARLTYARRLEMVRQMSEQGVSPCSAIAAPIHRLSRSEMRSS